MSELNTNQCSNKQGSMQSSADQTASPHLISPPPAPPPPAPPTLPSQGSVSSSSSSDVIYEPLKESDDAWIENVQSLLQHLPAWKQSVADSSTNWIWIVSNTRVSSIIQKREQPVCGLLALGMASEMLSLPWKHIWDVAAVAKEHGFTRYGEMFSARWLLDLAKGVYGMDGCIEDGNVLRRMETLIKHLGQGNPLLVAYDTDANFEPCCKKGHKAHWAVLTGFVYRLKREQVSPTVLDQLPEDKVIKNLHYLPKPPMEIENIPLPTSPDDVFVIAKQGKSKRYAVWSYVALCESNSNLEELSPAREADERDYVIPKEGVKGGLADQIVLLKRR